METQNAVLSQRVLELNLTNEGGIDGTFRLLKNITGLWLVQQCKKAFEARGLQLDYGELARLAEEAPKPLEVIDPDDPSFINPPDMVQAIQTYCRKNEQAVPVTEGALVRCALEGLAAKYARVLAALEEVTGNRINVIHIVGGGSRNQLLNQLTANRCGRRVIAGPVETTALGNVLAQVRAAVPVLEGERRAAHLRKCATWCAPRENCRSSSLGLEELNSFPSTLKNRPCAKKMPGGRPSPR